MGTEALKYGVPGGSVAIGELRFVPMIAPDAIAHEVDRVAERLTERYAGTNPLVVCVLAGAAIFHSDLVRRLSFPLELDYIRVSSYNGALSSSGTIIFTAESSTRAEGRNVIIVEDIVDTGRTVQRLREYFSGQGAATVAVASLLYKREADLHASAPEFVAFEIPNHFVIGYGLDYMGQGRNLPAVYVLDEGP
jgi:hypoxanthine phosphoribosyltransferase